ncbi:KH domain-containing, RNA-binding, signal transduction-associated protein 2 [Aphelenchoides fujianensis]|nr:KH domain-containing, RNA-binding, signal transduction-associated protein 2 [Aphelenchoides fujianensis]
MEYGGYSDSDRKSWVSYREPPCEYPQAPVYEQKFEPWPCDAVGGGGGAYLERFEDDNQPVYPPVDECHPTDPRKRSMNDNPSAFYPPKVPRSHDNRPGSFGNRFGEADNAAVLQQECIKCIKEISEELAVLETSVVPEIQYLTHTKRLLNEEISKIKTNMNPDWVDVESQHFKAMIFKRVLLPPARGGNNVVGRILGVGGQTLQKICQTYKCHISICGSGSRKNPIEEADLLASGDPRYSHLACPLHAEISTTGSPQQAYTRLGQILTLLQRLITSDESFEHDGIMFEFAHRRCDSAPDFDTYREERGHSSGEYDKPSRCDLGGCRGRPSPRGHDEQRGGEENCDDLRQSPRPEDSGPRGGGVYRGPRGRGGFVPRRRGGFVPRGRTMEHSPE